MSDILLNNRIKKKIEDIEIMLTSSMTSIMVKDPYKGTGLDIISKSINLIKEVLL